jgi:hypothetical protein
MNTRTPLLACTLAGLFLALPPALVSAAPPPSTSVPTDTPAVAVVRQFLADRAEGRYDDAYALLSAGSQKAVLKEDFAAGPPPSSSAEVASAARDLSTVALGLGALLVDPHNTLGYSFTVVGPDPVDPSVVLVRAVPPTGAVKLPTVSVLEAGIRHAAILRLLTVIDPAAHAPRVAAAESLEQGAVPGELDEEREQAHRMVSLAHLEQLSVGIILYAKAHHETMPDADHWADEIMPYVKDSAAFRDPSAPAGEAWSYAYNSALSHKSLAQFDYPAHTVLLFESTSGTKNASDTGQSVPVPGWHLGGTDYVTADGHAQWFADGTKLSYRLDGK